MIYDLTSYFHGEVQADDLLFKHVANREITITAGIGSVETPPLSDFDAIIKVNGSEVSGSSMVVAAAGTVTISLSEDLVLSVGDVLEVFADSSISSGATNLATTFEASIDGDESLAYDISSFSHGLIGYDEPVLYALVPRACRIDARGNHRVSVGIEATNNPVVFSIDINDTSIGYLIIDGSSYFFKFNSIQNHVSAEDRIIIRSASGDPDTAVDATLANVAVNIQAVLT
jgi:hypothetical protein